MCRETGNLIKYFSDTAGCTKVYLATMDAASQADVLFQRFKEYTAFWELTPTQRAASKSVRVSKIDPKTYLRSLLSEFQSSIEAWTKAYQNVSSSMRILLHPYTASTEEVSERLFSFFFLGCFFDDVYFVLHALTKRCF
jgi:hypothetical protein